MRTSWEAAEMGDLFWRGQIAQMGTPINSVTHASLAFSSALAAHTSAKIMAASSALTPGRELPLAASLATPTIPSRRRKRPAPADGSGDADDDTRDPRLQRKPRTPSAPPPRTPCPNRPAPPMSGGATTSSHAPGGSTGK
jgi:hypothetical protein